MRKSAIRGIQKPRKSKIRYVSIILYYGSSYTVKPVVNPPSMSQQVVIRNNTLDIHISL